MAPKVLWRYVRTVLTCLIAWLAALASSAPVLCAFSNSILGASLVWFSYNVVYCGFVIILDSFLLRPLMSINLAFTVLLLPCELLLLLTDILVLTTPVRHKQSFLVAMMTDSVRMIWQYGFIWAIYCGYVLLLRRWLRQPDTTSLPIDSAPTPYETP